MTTPIYQPTNKSNKAVVSTLVVSRPGIMRQSLRAMLSSYTGIAIIASAGDSLTALNQVLHHQPGLLVIDSNLLDEEVEALLRAVKAQAPNTRCLIFVDSNRRETQLLTLGADVVIERDSPPQQLQATLFQLLPKSPDGSAESASG